MDDVSWSEERQEIAKNFIRTCETSHGGCKYIPTPLPTRVLYIGLEREDPYLHISTGNEESTKYATLSHCWGGGSPIDTTKSTLPDRRRGIIFYSLPQTFQNAILVARSLGIQYLWIDSLCILQDDLVDWEKEAAKMSSVYANCYLMIAADRSTNPNGGCFRPPGIPASTLSSVARPGFGGRSSKLYFRMTNLRDVDHNQVCHRLHDAISGMVRTPLDERGWCLQERILAPRILHFGEEEMAWECTGTLACECQSVVTNWDGESRFKNERLLTDSQDPMLWPLIVTEFTRRHLSFDKDILHAVSGLVDRMNTGSPENYFAGIWRGQIPSALLWKPDYEYITQHQDRLRPASSWPNNDPSYFSKVPRRHVTYYAPSWSWASVIGPIKFSDKESSKRRSVLSDGLPLPDTDIEGHVDLLKRVTINYSFPVSSLYGPPKDANSVLTVWGPTARALFKKEEKKFVQISSKNGGLLLPIDVDAGDEESVSADFEPDMPDSRAETRVGEELLMLWVTESATGEDILQQLIPEGEMAEGHAMIPYGRGLVLKAVGIKAGSYRRVGTFYYQDPAPWEGWRKLRGMKEVLIL